MDLVLVPLQIVWGYLWTFAVFPLIAVYMATFLIGLVPLPGLNWACGKARALSLKAFRVFIKLHILAIRYALRYGWQATKYVAKRTWESWVWLYCQIRDRR